MENRPAWWERNERLREEMDLPPYRPPRFADGTFTHEVVPGLEDEFDCTIQFLGVNTVYPDNWEVHVDGDTFLSVGRVRDNDGNTVYKITADEFRARVEEYFDG